MPVWSLCCRCFSGMVADIFFLFFSFFLICVCCTCCRVSCANVCDIYPAMLAFGSAFSAWVVHPIPAPDRFQLRVSKRTEVTWEVTSSPVIVLSCRRSESSVMSGVVCLADAVIVLSCRRSESSVMSGVVCLADASSQLEMRCAIYAD